MTPHAVKWNRAARHPALGRDEVHVWRAFLDEPPEAVAQYRGVMSPDELERAARFHFEKHSLHFVVARGALRMLLGRYLGRPPESLRFEANDYGKPSLRGAEALRFNLSHSHGIALYAFTLGRELGVDVEYVREDFDGLQIAGRYFSPREVEALTALPDGVRRRAFFECWSRKEAYIKARGLGLSMPLDSFDVSLAPDEPAALLRADEAWTGGRPWSLVELRPGDEHVGALAVEGDGWTLSCRQWAV